MRASTVKPCAVVAASAVLAWAAPASTHAQGDVSCYTVALSGQPAPGTPAGVRYGDFFWRDSESHQPIPFAPEIDRTGHVAFTSYLSNSGGFTDQALFAGPLTSPQLVARQGAQAPGMPPGVNYSRANYQITNGFTLNDNGEVAFLGFVEDPTTSFVQRAIFAGPPAAVSLLVRGDHPAPGTAEGASYGNLGHPRLNNTGQVAFGTFLYGPGATFNNDDAVYSGSPASLTLVARSGDRASSTPPGVNYSGAGLPLLNDAGQLIFSASLSGPDVTFRNDTAIYFASPGSPTSPTLVARAGDRAPGTPPGGIYLVLGDPAFNNRGEVAFPASARIPNSGDDPSAIYMGSPIAVAPVVRGGQGAPGTSAGVSFSRFSLNFFSGIALNDSGHLAFRSALEGTGVTGANDSAIFSGPPSALSLVAREGSPAPGTPEGTRYGNFGPPVLNNAGQLAFMALLDNAETPDDLGLFAHDPLLGTQLIVRTGDLFDVGGGDLRQTAHIGFSHYGPADLTQKSLGDDGRLAFTLVFTDGSSGVFVATVPEPAGLTLLATGLAGLLGRRGRRRA